MAPLTGASEARVEGQDVGTWRWLTAPFRAFAAPGGSDHRAGRAATERGRRPNWLTWQAVIALAALAGVGLAIYNVLSPQDCLCFVEVMCRVGE